MAPVNPEIRPTNDPTFGTNSRAVDTPEPIRVRGVEDNRILPKGQEIGDRSAEFLGQSQAAGIQAAAVGQKGWGDLFSNIVGIGDYLGKAGVAVVKKDIENKVYEVADKERQQYTAELEGMLNKTGTKNLLNANASTEDGGGEVPEDLESLPDDLAVLQSARAGGKITKLDYQGRLLEAAKTLRSQHRSPEMRQYIDEQFAKVTGQNPANAKINSLITTLNQQAGAGAAADKAVDSFFKANQGLPNMNENYAKVKSGLITKEQFMMTYTPYKQAEETIRINDLLMKQKDQGRTETARRANKLATSALGPVVAAEASKIMGEWGLDSPEKVLEMDNAQKAGLIPQKSWEQKVTQISQKIAQLEVSLPAKMDERGVTSRLEGGVEERNKLVKAHLEPLYRLRDSVISKDFGGMHGASRDTQVVLDEGARDMVRDSVAGPIAILTNNLNKFGADDYTKKMQLQMALGEEKVPQSMMQWYKGFKYRFNTNAANPNEAVTINQAFDEMRKKGIEDPAAARGLVNEINKIGMKDWDGVPIPDKIKEGLIITAFSENNRGFLSKLNMDGFDQRGRPISGAHAVFQKWTAPEVTNEVKRLSKTNPRLWEMYEGWARDTFANEVVNKEIRELSGLTKDPNTRITWSTENKRFDIERTAVPQLQANFRGERGGEGLNSAETVANIKKFEQTQATLNRINMGISNLKNVAQEGMQEKDVDGYLLQAIANAAGSDAIKNVQGIPNEMLNKIMLGRAYSFGNRK